jgi:hypothetical protein
VLDKASISQPWDRQPNETQEAWARFQAYRDSAYPRGLAGPYVVRPTAEILAEAQGTTAHAIGQTSSRNQWHARAAAYDLWVDHAKQESDHSAIDKMRQRHMAAVVDLTQLVAIERKKLLVVALATEHPTLTPRDLVALQELAIKHDRLLHGQDPDAPTGQVDLTEWPVEELQLFHDLLSRNGALGEG